MEFLASKHNMAFHPIRNQGDMKYLPSHLGIRNQGDMKNLPSHLGNDRQGLLKNRALSILVLKSKLLGKYRILFIPIADQVSTCPQSQRLTLLSGAQEVLGNSAAGWRTLRAFLTQHCKDLHGGVILTPSLESQENWGSETAEDGPGHTGNHGQRGTAQCVWRQVEGKLEVHCAACC